MSLNGITGTLTTAEIPIYAKMRGEKLLARKDDDSLKSSEAIVTTAKIIDQYVVEFKDKTGFEDPLMRSFLLTMIQKGKISAKETGELVNIHRDGTGLIRLLCYALVNKVRILKQMSPRYAIFLRDMMILLKTPGLKFKLNDEVKSPSDARHDQHFYLHKENVLKVNLKAADFNRLDSQTYFEASLLHELFHIWQDNNRLDTKSGLIEASAYLAAYDFVMHADSKLLIEKYWFRRDSYSGEGGSFNVPASLVRQLKDVPEQNAELSKGIALIRRNYLWMVIFVDLISMPQIQSQAREFSEKFIQTGRTLSLPILKTALEITAEELSNASLVESEERLASLLVKFVAFAHALLAYIKKIGTIDQYIEQMNHCLQLSVEKGIEIVGVKGFEYSVKCDGIN